jgi:pectate lyase
MFLWVNNDEAWVVISFTNVNDGINTRVGAELLVQNNVFENVGKPLYSTDNGYANASGNDFGGKSNTAPTSKLFILFVHIC